MNSLWYTLRTALRALRRNVMRSALTTLGIGPIVTAGLILQLLQGSDLLKLDLGNPEDRAIFGSATKMLTFVVIAVEAAA